MFFVMRQKKASEDFLRLISKRVMRNECKMLRLSKCAELLPIKVTGCMKDELLNVNHQFKLSFTFIVTFVRPKSLQACLNIKVARLIGCLLKFNRFLISGYYFYIYSVDNTVYLESVNVLYAVAFSPFKIRPFQSEQGSSKGCRYMYT